LGVVISQQARKRGLNVSDKQRYEILIRGNALAKTHARRIMGRRKLGRFLGALDHRKAASLGVKPEQLDAINSIPAEDRTMILQTQEVAHAIFHQFDRMAIRIARTFGRRVGRNNAADIAQLESEARVGLLKAIRGYSKPEIKFITYAYRAILNEVSRYLQRGMGDALSGVNSTLLVRYKRKLEELTKASLPNSFEDVCRALELTDKQAVRMKLALRAEVSSEGDMEESLAKLLTDHRKDTTVDLELIARLESASLTRLEKYAWISQSEDIRTLFPDSFQSLKDVATHFGVTPQAASEALKRARRKLAVALGDTWNPGCK
jgi:RNA polymerase sigma factor (sigma-70 family)